MKKLFAFILAVIMTFCVCGCNGNTTDVSSEPEQEIEYEQIYLDENGNVISKPETITSSQEDTSGTMSNSDADNSSTTSDNKDAVSIDYNTVVEVDICDDVVRAYLDAQTPERQFSWLNEYSGVKYDYQVLELDWDFDGSSVYTITFSENADFSNPYIVQTSYMNLKNLLLVPGKTYYWKVIGTWNDQLLGGGKIHVKDAPVRWINIDGVGNVRDMGGWKAEGGKTVKYGMLYRGRQLAHVDNNGSAVTDITEEGLKTFKSLGIKTELDLRYERQKVQAPGTGMNYVFIETNTQYHTTLTGDAEKTKANYKKMFELLSNESNYPFYTHCSAGADRTGTFAFIVNGVLGVSYEDLTRDFELTSFSASGKRWRGAGIGNTFTENDLVMQEDSSNTVAWGRLYKEMMAYGAKNGYTTLQESIEYWLTSYVGVPKSNIDSFKSIVLE